MPRWSPVRERFFVAGLLLLHLGLALWGAARNSVTFDENFHLPAGVVEVARRHFDVSPVNPPLLKAACGAAALAAGARLPADSALAAREQAIVGESFMRRNADRYHQVFFAARGVVIALSLLLGFLIWRFARRLHGPRGGALALALYALAPEALAHAGFVTMDLATGLGFLAAVYAWWGFARSGRWGWWIGAALAMAFTFLVRFSAPLLFPILAGVGIALQLAARVRRPRRMWLGLAAFALVAWGALDLGYLGQIETRPLRERAVLSRSFQRLQAALPGLRLPLPRDWLTGLDLQSAESREGDAPTFVLGRVTNRPVRWYFPFALAIKWPLGFWGALVLAAILLARRRTARRGGDVWTLALTPLAFLVSAMFLVNLNVGIRYLFPILPFLCVGCGALAGERTLGHLPRASARRWLRAGVALAVLQGLEAAWTAPFYLSSFNLLGGGPGGGYRLINDSNVDWGQGLIELREILQRRGIGKVYLCYHGSTDPAIYGIDYIPFRAHLGQESEWLAVSSYFFVGQAQRMMTPTGFTPFMTADFSRLWNVRPAAVAGRSIYLFHLPEILSKGPPPRRAGT